MKPLHYALAVLFLSTACARRNPATVPSPDTPQPSSPITSPRTGNWALTPDENFHSYTSKAVTTLELREEAGMVRDSFAVTLDFTMRIHRNTESSRVTGTLDRLQREAGNRASQAEPPVAMPFSFTGRVTSGGLFLDSAGGHAVATVADCESAGLNQMGVVQRNLSVVPLMLQTGTSWIDSSTVTICSGSIPVEFTSVRTYTVAGEIRESGDGAIVVERSERTRATGEGTQGQHRVGLQATGSGSARLFLEPATGLLRLAEGESRTAITIRSSGRQQQFVQTVKERTTRVR